MLSDSDQISFMYVLLRNYCGEEWRSEVERSFGGRSLCVPCVFVLWFVPFIMCGSAAVISYVRTAPLRRSN